MRCVLTSLFLLILNNIDPRLQFRCRASDSHLQSRDDGGTCSKGCQIDPCDVNRFGGKLSSVPSADLSPFLQEHVQFRMLLVSECGSWRKGCLRLGLDLYNSARQVFKLTRRFNLLTINAGKC
ncbi:hypothetical protein BV898_14982 [Hypsibius exemplaris]|uniref:Secreted protein n=1 Tax=Hypsibius exemplaris TaxID=2072580 RepID=A0A9X6ND60_HYPEX|nr:hypothetical protein BV898_14982 [Hypsibius exemplaris]